MSIIHNLQITFPNLQLNNCLSQHSLTYFGVIDDGLNKCYVEPDGTIKADFKVFNNDAQNINFLAIDKCIFSRDYSDERCDFALFDDSQFTFIEIKAPQNLFIRTRLINKAFRQLEATILEFNNQNVFRGVRIGLEAIVCLVVNKQSYPVISTSILSKQVEFSKRYKTILRIERFKVY